MKTGNSILAVFFFYMAFRIPVEINALSLAYDIPDAAFYKFLSLVLFGLCIMLGCVSLEYGRENRLADIKAVDKKITDLPLSLKASISDVGKGTVSNVDKSLPVLEAVVNNDDDFTKVSNNINDVIRSK